jgi:hypothetical protein
MHTHHFGEIIYFTMFPLDATCMCPMTKGCVPEPYFHHSTRGDKLVFVVVVIDRCTLVMYGLD